MSNVFALNATPAPSVSELARIHGVSRRTIVRWQKGGWLPSEPPPSPVPPVSRPTGPRRKKSEISLSVYFIRAGQDHVKIGSSRNVMGRLSDLQAAHHEELELLSVIPNAKQSLEFELHKKFEKDHIRGEWFRLSLDLRAFIISSGLPPE